MDQKVTDLAERVAALEEFAKNHTEDRDEMRKLLNEIKGKLDRWEGKFGGVLFMVWCIWMFFSGFAKAIADWFSLSGKG